MATRMQVAYTDPARNRTITTRPLSPGLAMVIASVARAWGAVGVTLTPAL